MILHSGVSPCLVTCLFLLFSVDNIEVRKGFQSLDTTVKLLQPFRLLFIDLFLLREIIEIFRGFIDEIFALLNM